MRLSQIATAIGVRSNRGLFSSASLYLDFTSGNQTLDSRITFTRASAATRTNAQGLIETTPVNLLTYSDDFSNAAWAAATQPTIVANAGTAPDGTSTADKLTVASNITGERRDQTVTVSASTAYVFSAYIKKGNASDNAGQVRLTVSGTASYDAYFTATDTWQRISVAVPTSNVATSVICRLYVSSTGGAVGDSILAWGAQLEQRSQASTYIPTTSSISGAPRFDYDPVTLQPKGLLIEEQRTNLLSASQDFEAPVWTKSNATVNANCVVAPDGTTTADKLVENTANNWHYNTQTVSVTSGTAYTYTVYAKAAERTSAFIGLSNVSGTLQGTAFTLTGSGSTSYWGVFSAPTSSSITAIGNGWYRCSITVTAANTAGMECRVGTFTSGTPSYTGDGSSGIYIWGAQLEAGAFATSYVPTPISFTSRASTATYKGSNGLIQTAAINTARYEPNASGGSNLLLESAATNLLTYSEQFDDAAWTKSNATITANAVTAPDGTTTGDKLVLSATATGSAVQTKSVTAGNSYTHSAYVKAGELAYFQISDNTWNASWGQTTSAACTFNLSAGTAGAVATSGAITGASASINSVGNGWYRCAISYTITAGTDVTNTQQQNNAVTAGVAGQGLYIWGAQLETGSVATSYVPSVETFTSRASTATYYGSNGLIQTAASNVARINYNPLNLSVPGKLLLEPAATNLLTYSEQFDNAAWTKNNATVTANAITAPDGATTADKLVEDSAASYHYAQTAGITITSGVPYTASLYVKDSGRSFIQLGFSGASNLSATFNTTLGTVTSTGAGASSASITPVGNGWYRISVTGTSTSTAGQFQIFLANTGTGAASYTGDGTSGIYIWGAQLETGTSATSYIPTTTAQVTRAADVSSSAQGTRAADVYSAPTVTRSADAATMTGTNFSSWYNSAEGTVYGEAADFNKGSSGTATWCVIANLSDGNTSYANDLLVRCGAPQYIASGGTGWSSATTPSVGSSPKIAVAYKGGSNAASFGGNIESSATPSSAPVGINRLVIGNSNTAVAALNGHIKRLAYYPKRLSNTELQGITA